MARVEAARERAAKVARARDDYALGCRVYRTEKGASGLPPEGWIRQALEQAAGEAG